MVWGHFFFKPHGGPKFFSKNNVLLNGHYIQFHVSLGEGMVWGWGILKFSGPGGKVSAYG